jgi:hypothetical protein
MSTMTMLRRVALRKAGVPVFPSADQAIHSLGRYRCHAMGRS